MKTTEDLFKVSEEIGQGVKSEIQGGREMTGTRTNRQGAANPLAIEYNKRSEAINGLKRLNGILGNHALQLTFVGRGKRAADERLLHKLASESEEAEAIARAVCGYVIDHPDDSIVAGEAKRAYGHNDTLLKYQCNGKVGDEVALGLDRLTYWQHLASVDIELQKALSCIPATATANSQAQGETTPQKQGNKPQQVPSWATTDVAKRVFAKAVELGYMSPLEYGYSWKLKSKALLAYFVECLSKTDMLTPYPDTEACAYFHATCLRQRRQSYLSNIQGGRPKDFDKIDALFE